MNLVLFDDPLIRTSLLPLTFTRPVAEIRVGILKISEKWERRFGSVSFKTEEYLSTRFLKNHLSNPIFINGAVCPTDGLIKALETIKPGEALWTGDVLIAAHDLTTAKKAKRVEFNESLTLIDQLWKIFKSNAAEIRLDYELITAGRTSRNITDPNTVVYGKENLFIEEGVNIKAAVINAEKGPIYIGKDVVIQEGAMIAGSHAFCDGSVINMGAKLRGDSTVGPHSKVGGEVSNSVIFGYSNKGHDGFLGNSVLGEWCNLGADTNTSNLKNDYGDVRLWNYQKPGFVSTGEMFCGLVMGDHSKCGINTMFNTGTVVGVSANIFGSGYQRNFVPSFSWGGATGFTTYRLNKAFVVATKVMERRDIKFDEQDHAILEEVFNQTTQYRNWENRS